MHGGLATGSSLSALLSDVLSAFGVILAGFILVLAGASFGVGALVVGRREAEAYALASTSTFAVAANTAGATTGNRGQMRPRKNSGPSAKVPGGTLPLDSSALGVFFGCREHQSLSQCAFKG